MNRLKLNHKKLCGHKNTTVVVINDYSVSEVDQLLKTVLGLESCPPNVAEMVHKLSGGNPFWCNEMALFIFKTGAGNLLYILFYYIYSAVDHPHNLFSITYLRFNYLA